MNGDLPLWASITHCVLDPLVGLGNWASFHQVRLLDKHCRCEICKKDGRGAYRNCREPIIKRWTCGCVTLFYKSHGTNLKPNLGFRVWKCEQCEIEELNRND